MIDATINAGPKGIIIFKVNCFPITDKIKTDMRATLVPIIIIGMTKNQPNHDPNPASNLKSPTPNPSTPLHNRYKLFTMYKLKNPKIAPRIELTGSTAKG